jgi:SAM-dependent methyltransferase
MSDAPSHRLFAAVYDLVNAGAERRLLPPHREYLTDGLSGTVLDVGAGTGASFPYFRDRAAVASLGVHAVEPDPHMAKRARARAEELDLAVDVREEGAEATGFADDTFDYAVAGVVFCTITDPEAALDELARVLKPGAELRFLEHVRNSGPRARGQRLAEPVWKRLAGGCHLTRDTVSLFVAHEAFELVELERIEMGVFPVTPFVRGRLRRVDERGPVEWVRGRL